MEEPFALTRPLTSLEVAEAVAAAEEEEDSAAAAATMPQALVVMDHMVEVDTVSRLHDLFTDHVLDVANSHSESGGGYGGRSQGELFSNSLSTTVWRQ